jgi:hypothetical protein
MMGEFHKRKRCNRENLPTRILQLLEVSDIRY